MKPWFTFYRRCRESESNFLLLVIRAFYIFLFYRKKVYARQKTTFRGLKNIEINDRLEIGIRSVGFMHRWDRTYLNIEGKLILKGGYSIGSGSRIHIGKDAHVEIGNGGYMNANTRLIIMHHMTIGNGCAISWDCQFLDEDFHQVDYSNKKQSDPSIVIGDHVWIGCGSKIYKGTIIPDGCVIASDSVVKGKFTLKRALIGGNPAKVIKENIDWH